MLFVGQGVVNRQCMCFSVVRWTGSGKQAVYVFSVVRWTGSGKQAVYVFSVVRWTGSGKQAVYVFSVVRVTRNIGGRLVHDAADDYIPDILNPGVLSESELLSSVYLLKGTVYQALDNHQFAAECFKLALKEDPYCVEAYEHLVFNHYYTGQCEEEIINDTLNSSGTVLCLFVCLLAF